MKRDKFVTPKGELPVKTPRPPRAPKVTPPDSDPAAIPTTLEPVRLVHEANQIMMDDGVGFPENEIWGEFAFRDTILDQLDRYWVYLARMKKHDNDAYEFYKQIGATVVPPVHWFLHKGARWKEDDKPMKAKPLKPLSPWWKQHRPGFGCVTYGIYSKVEEDEMAARFEGKDRNKRMWVPKFLYFVKYRQPPANVQPCSGGDVYKMTVWWDKPARREDVEEAPGGVPEDYAVFVSADGSDVHVLPMHEDRVPPHPAQARQPRLQARQDVHRPAPALDHPQALRELGQASRAGRQHVPVGLFLDAAHSRGDGGILHGPGRRP